MRFKTKQKGLLKADEIHKARYNLVQFVETESIQNGPKSITSSNQILKALSFAKLLPFIEDDRAIQAKNWQKRWNLDYNTTHPILLTNEHTVVQLLLERAHQDNLHEGAENLRNML